METDLILHMKTFSETAKRFCNLVEDHANYQAFDFVSKVQTALVNLYREALDLPEPEPETETHLPADSHHMPGPYYEGIQKILGKADAFWAVFDPTECSEPVQGSIADALTDIYSDLREGFLLFDKGASRSEVIWHWRFQFRSHWGTHAVDAIKVCHWLLVDHMARSDEEAPETEVKVE